MNSSDSRSSSSLTSGNSSHSAHSHPSTNQVGHHRHRSLSTPLNPAHRLSSVSSQDSGFTSQDTLFMRPGTPTSQHQQQNYAGMPIRGSHEYARQVQNVDNVLLKILSSVFLKWSFIGHGYIWQISNRLQSLTF